MPSLRAATGRWILLLSVFLAACGVGVEPIDDSDWQEFVVPGALLSVRTPQPLEASSQSATTDAGEIVEQRFAVVHSGVGLLAGYTRLPQAINDRLRRDSLDRLMDDGRDGLIEKLGAELVSERRLMLGGLPDGREVVARLPASGDLLIFRSYWVESTLYHVQATLPAQASPAQQRLAERFLDSLRISAKRS